MSTASEAVASVGGKVAHRLQVFFSNRHVVGRVVRPADGHIVASASTLEDRRRIARRKIGDEENNSNSSSTDDETKSTPTEQKAEGRERLASTSDKSACKHIGKLLAERLKKIQLDAINFEGLQSSTSKKNEKYSGRRASFQPKRKRFGGKLSALLESLKENGVEIH
ncbi:unnamed protein product [Bathycoccus prasinos]|jgi:ribosomal protein L18|tara:strand:- start:287 stop:787 length:501 start_codon:yes stop_codon:yes gene_type:complete